VVVVLVQEIQDLYNLPQQFHQLLVVLVLVTVHLVQVELLQLRLQTEDQETHLLLVHLKDLMEVRMEDLLVIQVELVVVEQPYKEVHKI
jgi:hypothetical protein|tara:strand:+ start:135 stop:401 length:267 start_codon:yes stop_codon:yes gene_type:complete